MLLWIYRPSWIYRVQGDSMGPTFRHDDLLLVGRRPDRSGMLHRGDIVLANGPGAPERYYLKRVVGMPGERLALEDGLLMINGDHLHEPYLNGLPACLSTECSSWQLGNDMYFLMGDNRAHSTDSREYGPVASSAIIGRLSRRLWPPSRWRGF